MTDEHHRLARVCHGTYGGEELFYLWWCEQCGGLVKQQHFSTLVKRFHDLHSLPFACRQLAHYRPRVEWQAVVVGDLLDFALNV